MHAATSGRRITMACFAASARPGGFCFAGKDVRTGEWIRPLTSATKHAIDPLHRMVAKGDPADVGDRLTFRVGERHPIGCQTENCIRQDWWRRTGRLDWHAAQDFVDCPDSLWENADSTRHGRFDTMSEAVADDFNHSLLLIRVDDCELAGVDEGVGGQAKHRVRARFAYRGIEYRLRATDPHFNLAVGTRMSTGPALLCCSVTEPWAVAGGEERRVYKLAAGIITAARLA